MADRIDEQALSRLAFDILVADLVGHGNTLSDMHRAALFELVDTFTHYCTGKVSGRRALPLPTGTGKTSAIAAWLAAAHRLGYRIPVSIAASRVEALCRLKRDLIEHDIPESLIGLRHSLQYIKREGPGPHPALEAQQASEPSTEESSHLVQLVTHARVRSNREADFALFGTYLGEPRALTIYDEALMRADSFAFEVRALKIAIGAFREVAEDDLDPLVRQAASYLQGAQGRIGGALVALQAGGDPECCGAEVHLDELEPGIVKAYSAIVERHGRSLRGFSRELLELLAVSQDTLRVIGSEQGNGVVTAREVVPPALRNVVILDASAPIRELAKLDPTITVVEHFEAAQLKSFERVEVRQLLSPGGRSTITASMSAASQEASAVALEVANIVREGWATEKAFLIFTFIQRLKGPDMVAELKKGLRQLGIDVDAKTEEGQPRLNWLTWGNETSLNGFEFCTSVVMAGVLHRSHLDLAAAVRGQVGNPAEPTPSSRIRGLIESEIASCIYQGASRGSCRRIDHGKAQAMRLWFIHREPGIKAILDKVMPGAQWSYPDPVHLRKAAADSKAARLLEQLLGYLRGLPEEQQKVSSSRAKKALALADDQATARAFSRAVGLLDLVNHGWMLLGRSLVRGAAAYGFPSTTN